jgi:argonaute-like protein implicated in RNA metabolism and viral defense
MFETAYKMKIRKKFIHEFKHETKDKVVENDKLYDADYYKCYEGLKRMFNPNDMNA